MRRLRDESRKLIAELEARYVAETGVSSLKIRHNTMLGYYVEVPAKHADRLPSGAKGPFILRQSMVGAQRYATVELSDLESRIARAAEQTLALELELFDDLVKQVVARAEAIGLAARAIATLDVAAALADLAVDCRWTRPIVDDGPRLRDPRRPPPGGRGGDGGARRGRLCRE